MRIVWTKRARRDMSMVGAYIASDNPRAARQFLARLQQRVRQIGPTAFAGRRVPELDREDIREVIEGKYRIVYRVVRETTIHVLTVFEGHHLLPSDLESQSREDGADE